MVSSSLQPTADPVASPRRPGQGLITLAIIGVSGVGLSMIYSWTGLGVGCPMRALTGWDCPFCGGTRMGAELLNGNITAAFWYNPAALIGLALATVAGVWLLIELLTGRRGWLAQKLSAPLRRRQLQPGTVALTVGVGLGVAWTIVRNLLIGPLP